MSKGLQGLVVGPDFSSGFSAFSSFGLGEVEADGVQELEKSYDGVTRSLVIRPL